MAMKPGMEAIMMPRKLMRFQTLPSCCAAFFEEPITGRYLSPHSLENAAIAETARVRFVVPVVPEAAITLQPMVCTSAIERLPVMSFTSSEVFSSAAVTAAMMRAIRFFSVVRFSVKNDLPLVTSSKFMIVCQDIRELSG